MPIMNLFVLGQHTVVYDMIRNFFNCEFWRISYANPLAIALLIASLLVTSTQITCSWQLPPVLGFLSEPKMTIRLRSLCTPSIKAC